MSVTPQDQAEFLENFSEGFNKFEEAINIRFDGLDKLTLDVLAMNLMLTTWIIQHGGTDELANFRQFLLHATNNEDLPPEFARGADRMLQWFAHGMQGRSEQPEKPGN